jgi:two-component system LytT family sensor kinase
MPPELLHVVGYVTGAVLYAMLLVMSLKEHSGDRLTVGAAILGLTWNVGELLGHGVQALRWSAAEPWIAAASFAALGFLPAVVIHSAARTAPDGTLRAPRLAHGVTALAYLSATAAAGLHLAAAVKGSPVPDSAGLIFLTAALVLLAPPLMLANRSQANARRVTWMTALAVFAVSALHVGSFHGPRETWAIELLGHHASIPLAFAILYQDYRFALADLFLKQALGLVLVVAVVFGLWSIAGPRFTGDQTSPEAIGLLLALWIASSFVFPVVRNWASRFVDRVVLTRQDDQELLDLLASRLQAAATEDQALDATCEVLRPALSATRITWELCDRQLPVETPGAIVIPTAEPPLYRLRTGRLAGGRRLLSDDLTTLERSAVLAGRRIDTLRLTAERYERVLQEREIRSLATEAELKALRAQINPHFLFNALTTIGYLVKEAPDRAVDTLLRLTTLLRSVLRTEGDFTTLRREAELIVCYLDIEHERFDERLHTTIDVPESIADLPIPTLLVQPLVENAVKHGIARSRSGGHISIRATLNPSGELHISVRNTGAPLRGRLPGPSGGMGLRNVEQRLASYYGDAARFSLTTADNGETAAEIWLPGGRDRTAGATPAARRVRA